uniref:Uncharacterized protein n=1 Tax=Sphaerodactylus townsendi TaxID=933632 RepID=A0ACB8F2R0_9SAUR
MELESLQVAPKQETFLTKAPLAKEATWVIQVSGETGIFLSHSDNETSQPLCDFPEITDISIKQPSRDGLPVENRIVSITKTDSRVLLSAAFAAPSAPPRLSGGQSPPNEYDNAPLQPAGSQALQQQQQYRLHKMEFLTLQEALSFVSLIDGYYRLTVDTQHYFCKEVAPPWLLENLENHCHGPITSEFAVNKLKATGHGAGSYLLRRNPEDFNSYLLTICIEMPIGKAFKSLLIQKNKDGTFSIAGIRKNFCSLRELLAVCQQCSLQVDRMTVQLGTHCPPQSKEKSNLLIVRGGSCHRLPTSPSAPRRAINQMMFHKIQAENLVQCENLGQGTFTRIYRGIKGEQTEEEEEEGEARNHVTDVVMKVLDLSHCNWVEPFLEAASMIGQLLASTRYNFYGVYAWRWRVKSF